MKKIMMSSVVALATLTASVSYAEPFSFVGKSEYSVMADQFETDIGVEYATGDWTVGALMNTTYDKGDQFQFQGVDIGVTYEIDSNWKAYGVVETDDSLNFDEFTLGTAFRF